MLGTSETIRRGGRARSTATPEASARTTITRSAGSASARRARASQPFDADRSGPRLLNPDGRGEIGPHARELFEDLPAGGTREAAIDQVALEIRLDEVPAPRGNHCGAQCIMASCG